MHLNSKQKTQFNKMDLTNILSATYLFIVISIAGVRSATVTLSKSTEKGQLGNNSVSLFCDYILSSGELVLSIDFKRKRLAESGFTVIVSYYEDNSPFNASYNSNASDLVGRTVITNPTSTNRKAILQFDSIQCADEADYRCEMLYSATGQGNPMIYSDTKIVVTDVADYRCVISYNITGQGNLTTDNDTIIVVTATPKFENQSLPYTPSTNLAENQSVVFTCIGNVGREPHGKFSWYKYLAGQHQPPGMVITNGVNLVSLTNVAGSCTYERTERLTLQLTKEDNQMVIRCTVQQTTITEDGDGRKQTDRIPVNYAPRINPIGSDPDRPYYSEGLAQLMLTCNADSYPLPKYIWTLPNGTEQTGFQLRLTSLTTNHTGIYICMSYTEWGGQNYTAKKSLDITVVETANPPTTTTIDPTSQISAPSKNGNTTAQQNADIEKENNSSPLFTILFGVVMGVSVVLVAILSICLHIHRKLAKELQLQLQNRSHTYDGLNMRVATSEPYAALNVEPSEDHQQSSNYLNPYEGLQRTSGNSQPYDILEKSL